MIHLQYIQQVQQLGSLPSIDPGLRPGLQNPAHVSTAPLPTLQPVLPHSLASRAAARAEAALTAARMAAVSSACRCRGVVGMCQAEPALNATAHEKRFNSVPPLQEPASKRQLHRQHATAATAAGQQQRACRHQQQRRQARPCIGFAPCLPCPTAWPSLPSSLPTCLPVSLGAIVLHTEHRSAEVRNGLVAGHVARIAPVREPAGGAPQLAVATPQPAAVRCKTRVECEGRV